MFQLVLDVVLVGLVFFGVLSVIFWIKDKRKTADAKTCCDEHKAAKSEKEA